MAQARTQDRQTTAKRTRGSNRILVRNAAVKTATVIKGVAEVTEVTVSKTRYDQINSKRGLIRKLLENYADGLAIAQKEGRTALLQVSADGRTAIVKGEAAADDPLDAAVAPAKARGRTKVADILKGADMLTARDFGPLIGASHETVNAKRKRHEVLGLEGATRGVKYPRWQVTDTGLPLPGLPKLFEVLGDQPWTVFRFLMTRHTELGGKTALDILKTGRVDAVVGVAENQAAGAFS